jgi:hypothetical protein
MSEIDSYCHKLLGFMHCPTDYPELLVTGHSSPITIALYKLEESVATWRAKAGDLVLGGGSGECPTFRISLPEAVDFLSPTAAVPDFSSRKDLYQNFWAPEEAFALCNGFLKIGWHPGEDVETWLAKQAVAFVSPADPQQYSLITAPEVAGEP